MIRKIEGFLEKGGGGYLPGKFLIKYHGTFFISFAIRGGGLPRKFWNVTWFFFLFHFHSRRKWEFFLQMEGLGCLAGKFRKVSCPARVPCMLYFIIIFLFVLRHSHPIYVRVANVKIRKLSKNYHQPCCFWFFHPQRRWVGVEFENFLLISIYSIKKEPGGRGPHQLTKYINFSTALFLSSSTGLRSKERSKRIIKLKV